MKVTGIIAEYNPFHNGHQYHMNETRFQTDADYIIVVMSGNYTQRGLPAVMDKYLRTRMALAGGADLVLELPLPYAAGSAEFFATGAVTLLDRLGTVNQLCFGSEQGEISPLQKAAELLSTEPPAYKAALQKRLAEGASYPAAQTYALTQAAAAVSAEPAVSAPAMSDLMSAPNNRLGIEYLKALLKRGSAMTPVTIRREGAGYHDAALQTAYSSALAIRENLLHTEDLSAVCRQMPAFTNQLLAENRNRTFPVSPDDFSLLLQYRLLTLSADANFPGSLCDFWDVSSDMADKIAKQLPQFSAYMKFCDRLKSKDITHTRISRSLLHILLDIRGEQVQAYAAHDFIPYARILGFRESAAPLLHAIKQNTSVPLLSKPADAEKLIAPWGVSMFKKEITASHIYESVISQKFHTPMRNEYTRQIIVQP